MPEPRKTPLRPLLALTGIVLLGVAAYMAWLRPETADRAWLGRDFAHSPVSSLPGDWLGKRQFGIRYMAKSNSCKVSGTDLGFSSVRGEGG